MHSDNGVHNMVKRVIPHLLFLLNRVVGFFEQTAEALVRQTNLTLTVETADLTFMGLNVCICI